jgi:uncharacterized YccA/Bax inhibitor family protein
MLRSGNPTLRQDTFTRQRAVPGEARMTIAGTVNKCALLLILLMISASWTWSKFHEAGGMEVVGPWIGGGAIGGLVVGITCAFWRRAAPFLAPLYALLEGLMLGGLSAALEFQYPGIVLQAVALTAGTLASLLIAYMTGAIRATENFKLGVMAATGGIFFIYLGTWILGFFGMHIPFIHDNGLFGIGFSVFVVIIAAMNLVLDFDYIEAGAAHGAPKYMEWYGAFALMVTLIWLYIEILRLLSKLRSR